MATYDPQLVIAVAVGVKLVGFSDGTYIKAVRNVDTWSIKVGSDGRTVRIKSADKSGRFTFTLQQDSPSNSALMQLVINDELTSTGLGATLVKDIATDQASASGAISWIVKSPDFERSKDLSDVEWTVETGEIFILQGSSVLP